MIRPWWRGRLVAVIGVFVVLALIVGVFVVRPWLVADRGPVALAAGGFHSCAVTTAGAVKCWGARQWDPSSASPTDFVTTAEEMTSVRSGVTAITAAMTHTCVVTQSGGLQCWGVNVRVPVGLHSGIVSAAAGSSHDCVLDAGGGVRCWGFNDFGQLGDGTTADAWAPVQPLGLESGVAAIAAGPLNVCAVSTDGGVTCWGDNGAGQVGDGTTGVLVRAPSGVTGLSSGVAAVSVGGAHACALTNEGGVKCWGWNGNGQLGNGTRTDSSIPVDVTGLSSGVAAVSARGGHTCALMEAGGVKCWGLNRRGQLGNGLTDNSGTPVDVIGLPERVTSLSAGLEHNCAATRDGAIWCWGANEAGQLGDGSTTDRATPVAVVGY